MNNKSVKHKKKENNEKLKKNKSINSMKETNETLLDPNSFRNSPRNKENRNKLKGKS